MQRLYALVHVYWQQAAIYYHSVQNSGLVDMVTNNKILTLKIALILMTASRSLRQLMIKPYTMSVFILLSSVWCFSD